MKTRDHILQKIANTLFINVQHLPVLGLFDGQAGVALFFYHYGNCTKKPMYIEFANELIEAVYNKISSGAPKGFANGLIGIGWAFNHIIENQFFKTGDDKIIPKIDQAIKKTDESSLLKDLNDDTPLCSKGIYALAKRDNDFIATILVQYRDLLEKKELSFPLCYLNSILYLVYRSYQSGIDPCLCLQILETVRQYIALALDNKRFAESDILTLQHLRRRIEQNIPSAANWHLPLAGIEISQKSIFSSCWNNLIYQESSLKQVDIHDIQTYVDSAISDLHQKDLTLCSGLAGLGIELIKITF